MNYDHHYHAGNFADVMKHIIMIAIIKKLQSKDKPLFILDTHAGAGQYDLQDERAQRTNEAQYGVQCIWNRRKSLIHPLLQQYVTILSQFNQACDYLNIYPGSPQIIQNLIIENTRFIACEKKPAAYEQLNFYLKYQPSIQVYCEDGYSGLNRMLPPPERRGLILIDPPFEVTHEFELLTKALETGIKKFAGGVYMIWYPIKHHVMLQHFFKSIMSLDVKNIFVAELFKLSSKNYESLQGSGILVVNLPYNISNKIENCLHECSLILSASIQFKARTFWLKQPM